MYSRVSTPLILPLVLLLLASVRSAPLINSPWGQISGTDKTSPGGAPYSVYHSIPYALPPVGERRFAKPVPHPGPGAGRVFNASTPGYICPQQIPGGQEVLELMNEDCLTLNVYVPTSGSAGPKSVMLWIHGGGFIMGSAYDYVPSELITSRDVIVVVIQYRLDVLGFLSSGDDVIPGNYGLWDQALALQWVKDNIRAFGGDPDALTVFGESAGSASVGYQVLSPVNRGVNFRAILQSGTPLASWAILMDSKDLFYKLANKTGCLPSDSWVDSMYNMVAGGGQKARHESILRCLRAKDITSLFQSTQQFDTAEDMFKQELWVPTVDGDFLPRNPFELIRDVTYLADVGATSRDIMIGINNEEGGLLFTMAESFELLASQDEAVKQTSGSLLDGKLARAFLTGEVLFRYGEGLRKDPHRLETLVNVLDFFYTQPLNGAEVNEQSVLDIFTDIYFTAPTVRFLQGLTKAADELRTLGRLPTSGRRYLYLFNHYPASRAGLTRGRGLYHGEDITYEFDRDAFPDEYKTYTFGAEDLSLADKFRSMVTSFAKSGTPRLSFGQTENTWPEFSMAEQKFLSLEPTPRVDAYLYSKRVALWLDLLPSLVNSTRGINMGSWAGPWNQQGLYCPDGYGYNCNNMKQMPVNFVFKGRIRFFKLH